MSHKSNPEGLSFGNGRYKVIKEIGEGGMAIVYQVQDSKFPKILRALKVLKSHMVKSREVRKRFLDEAQVMAQVEDNGNVRVFDFGVEEDGQVWIVMEFIDGGSLIDRLRDHGALSPKQTVEVGLAVLSALVVVHEQGIVHRDIKPHNILLTTKGRILIADFGIAHLDSQSEIGLTKVGTSMGTWQFMSPEQRADASSVDARADLYAVAAVLYCCLINKDNVPDLFTDEMAQVSWLVGIPDPLAEVIRKATRFNRDDRYSSAREMVTALNEARDQLLPESEVTSLIVSARKELTGKIDLSQPLEQEEAPGLTAVPMAENVVEKGNNTMALKFELPSRRRSRLWVGVLAVAVVAVVVLAVGVWTPVPSDEKLAVASVTSSATEIKSTEVQMSVSDPVITVPTSESEKSVQPVVVSSAENKKVRVSSKPDPLVDSSVKLAPVKIAEVAVSSPATVPVLEHKIPGDLSVGQPFTLQAKVTGTSSQYQLRVFYRLNGQGAFSNYPMNNQGGVCNWSTTIPSGAQKVEYFIKAESKEPGQPKLSSGSGSKPNVVLVKIN